MTAMNETAFAPAHGALSMGAAAAPEEKNVRFDGLTFPVLSWGPEGGRPVLLLHGFPQAPFTWTELAELLAADGFRLLAPAQRGYLPSTRPPGPIAYSFAQFVEDALRIAGAFHLKRFDVIGFGMGGIEAWMLAAYHAEKVRSLTSLVYPHPAAFAHAAQFQQAQREKWNRLVCKMGSKDLVQRARTMLADDAAVLRGFLADLNIPKRFIDRYVANLNSEESLVGAFSWQSAVSLDLFAQVPPVRVPSLLIWSEGPGVARETVEATRQYVGAPYRDVLIKADGHFLLETSSRELAGPIRDHLQST